MPVAQALAASVTAMPASSTSLEWARREEAKLATSKLAVMAPMNAATVTQGKPSTLRARSKPSAHKAPSVAPAVVPTVLGVASGF